MSRLVRNDNMLLCNKVRVQMQEAAESQQKSFILSRWQIFKPIGRTARTEKKKKRTSQEGGNTKTTYGGQGLQETGENDKEKWGPGSKPEQNQTKKQIVKETRQEPRKPSKTQHQPRIQNMNYSEEV